jgi:hypothetical protein
MEPLYPPLNPMVHHRIQQLAYDFWLKRGKPIGSPDDDWFRAEKEVSFQINGPAKILSV